MLPDKESCEEYNYTIKKPDWTCNSGEKLECKRHFFLHFGAMLIDLLIIFLLACIVFGILLFPQSVAIGSGIIFSLLVGPGIVFLLHKTSLRSIGEYLFCLKADKNGTSVWKMFYMGRGYLQTKISLIKIFVGIILILAFLTLCLV